MAILGFVGFVIFMFILYGMTNNSDRANAKRNRKKFDKLVDQLSDGQICELIRMLEE